MNFRRLALAVVAGLMTLPSAMADGPITLKAASGETIRIFYATQSSNDGDTAQSVAENVHVTVDGAIPGATRVVLISDCVPSNSWTSQPSTTIYDCGYGNDGSWLNSQNCTMEVQGSAFPSNGITTWWANHGGETNCYQQIAVSPTQNRWLVDPVSGQHNFNFRFPVSRR